ncbi:hypothetical protein DRN70_02855, partial [Methanosarcinales archaeon]
FSQDLTKKEENAVIFLFLGGGASSVELFNPIPTADSTHRSVTGYVNTNVPGMELGGLFKDLAKYGNRIALFRGFHHRDANHSSATHCVVTGQPNFGAGTTQKWPRYGSAASGWLGTNALNGLPTYIKMNSIAHDDAAFMGGKFVGYDATQQGRKDLLLSMELKRFEKRLKFLSVIDKDFGKGQRLAEQWTELRGQAVEIVAGDASEAFKIEADEDYDAFKEDTLGRDALTAVKIIQAGSRFVTLSYNGWDMHSNILQGMNTRQPILDKYIALLLDTLRKRGMNKKTMLVVTSEFGRTPINANAGRDHNARIGNLMIACDSYEMGKVVGSTDPLGTEATEGLCQPKDLRWTIFDHLQMPKEMKWTGLDGRPMHLVESESKNILK